jgi:hypothetical protein
MRFSSLFARETHRERWSYVTSEFYDHWTTLSAQLTHLLLIARAEEAAMEDQDQRVAVQEAQVLIEQTRPCELRQSRYLVRAVRQFEYVNANPHLALPHLLG